MGDKAPASIIERVGARIALVDAAGRLLMLRLWGGSSWILPGGGVEPDDPRPELAGLRELEEETGLRVGESAVVGALYERSFFTITAHCRHVHQRETVYLARLQGFGPMSLETGGREARWWSPRDFELGGESCRPKELVEIVRRALAVGLPSPIIDLGDRDERVRIRPAREGDLAAIEALGGPVPTAPAPDRTYIATMGPGTIVGCVHTGATRDEDDDSGRVGEIHAIHLTPESVGLGVGRQLFQYAARHHRTQGRTELTGWVDVTRARILRFYERMGCRPDGGERKVVDAAGRQRIEVRFRRLLDRDMTAWIDAWDPGTASR